MNNNQDMFNNKKIALNVHMPIIEEQLTILALKI